MINFQTRLHGVRMVILALNEGAAANVAHALGLRLFVKQMVGGAAFFADTASGHSGDDRLVGDFQVNDLVDLHHFVQSLGLGNGAGEAVQDVTVFAVVLL